MLTSQTTVLNSALTLKGALPALVSKGSLWLVMTGRAMVSLCDYKVRECIGGGIKFKVGGPKH